MLDERRSCWLPGRLFSGWITVESCTNIEWFPQRRKVLVRVSEVIAVVLTRSTGAIWCDACDRGDLWRFGAKHAVTRSETRRTLSA